MKTVNITYYGSGSLSLQHRRFLSRKTVSTRLDDILPSERKRFASKMLITDNDGRLINIGAEVPEEAALEAIKCNGMVLKEDGFDIHLPAGWARVDAPHGVRVIPAGDIVCVDGLESAGALDPGPIKEVTVPPPCPHDTDGDGNCGQKWCPNCNPKVAAAAKEMAEDYDRKAEAKLITSAAELAAAAEVEASSVVEAVPETIATDVVAEAAAEAAAEALMPKDSSKRGGKKNKQKKGESLADML